MQASRAKKNKEMYSKAQTKHLSVRVPENILKCIELLVNLGLFKDKSDFINYSLQETLKDYLMNIKIDVTPELINHYLGALEKASPGISEKEALKLLEEVRKSWRKNSLEDTQGGS